jgi:hypothetical protein
MVRHALDHELDRVLYQSFSLGVLEDVLLYLYVYVLEPEKLGFRALAFEQLFVYPFLVT